MRSPFTTRRRALQAFALAASTPEEFATLVRSEIPKRAKIVKASRAKVE